MARVLRGEILWADLDPVQGHEQAGFPLTLELRAKRLPKRSWAKISQIRTLSRERLGKRIGRLEPEQLDLLIEGLNEIVAGS